MTEEKLQLYINDFRLKYGITLDTHLKGNGDRKAEAFAERVEMIVLEEIKSKNPSYKEERLNDKQKRSYLESNARARLLPDRKLRYEYC